VPEVLGSSCRSFLARKLKAFTRAREKSAAQPLRRSAARLQLQSGWSGFRAFLADCCGCARGRYAEELWSRLAAAAQLA